MARNRDEPVRLTKIYTRGGDQGETSLGDGSRVPKTDQRVVAYGAVDELNSAVGVVLAGGVDQELRDPLERVQNDLFDLGADLCVPFAEADGKLRIVEAQVEELERLCDRFNEQPPPLKSFILPGGSETASRLHVARTICRRAEIEALRIDGANPVALRYLNRLSDLLFILARTANTDGAEPLWKPGASR